MSRSTFLCKRHHRNSSRFRAAPVRIYVLSNYRYLTLVEVLHLLAITEDQMASAQTSCVVSAKNGFTWQAGF